MTTLLDFKSESIALILNLQSCGACSCCRLPQTKDVKGGKNRDDVLMPRVFKDITRPDSVALNRTFLAPKQTLFSPKSMQVYCTCKFFEQFHQLRSAFSSQNTADLHLLSLIILHLTSIIPQNETMAFSTVKSIMSPVDASKLSGRYETTVKVKGTCVNSLTSIGHI